MTQEDENASANPIMVMVDERTGEKYSRAVMGKDQDVEWVIKDMSNEIEGVGALRWGRGNIILTSDGRTRDKGESQSNGLVEEAGENGQGVCAGTGGADRGTDEREAVSAMRLSSSGC